MSPTTATLKRLYAVSGNTCAFPNCRNSLVDAGGKVTGRVCHIKGRRTSAARYDPDQTNEEREAFENLVLMCPIHHDVIDADPGSYTVTRLTEIKAAHEAENAAKVEPNDAGANQFLQTVADNATVHGSVIYTHQQLGGQVAHTIANIGTQPRRIGAALESAILNGLRDEPVEDISVTAVLGDGESFQFATQLKRVLELAGWNVDGINQAIYSGPVEGVVIKTPAERPSFYAIGNSLIQAGLKASGVLDQQLEKVEIIVGYAS